MRGFLNSFHEGHRQLCHVLVPATLTQMRVQQLHGSGIVQDEILISKLDLWPSKHVMVVFVFVQGCIVEWEGRKKDNYFCFSVVDRSGLSLMRMSTSDANDAAVWVQVCPLFHSYQ